MLDPEKIRTPRNKYYPARKQPILEQYTYNLIAFSSYVFCGNQCIVAIYVVAM